MSGATRRDADTRAPILRMARERDELTLMQVVAKLSNFQTETIDEMVPYMCQYGRTQRRMYAGLTISDPETVTDNSDYPAGQDALPSTGIPFVIVEDTVVVSVLEGLGRCVSRPTYSQ